MKSGGLRRHSPAVRRNGVLGLAIRVPDGAGACERSHGSGSTLGEVQLQPAISSSIRVTIRPRPGIVQELMSSG